MSKHPIILPPEACLGTTHPEGRRMRHIAENLETQPEWDLEDYRDFYDRDVRFLLDVVERWRFRWDRFWASVMVLGLIAAVMSHFPLDAEGWKALAAILAGVSFFGYCFTFETTVRTR